MTEEIFEFILISIGILWLLWKFYKKRTLNYFSSATVLFCLQLAWWPLHLPIKFSFALLAFYAAGLLIYENRNKNN